MRVLAAIVVPPHMTASGGANAGERLSAALASHCDITVANMMAKPGHGKSGHDKSGHGKAQARRHLVRTSLPPGLGSASVPARYKSLFYRSDIPRMIETGRYDLVHLHNPMPALEMWRIARACLRAGIPYVVSTHGFNEVATGNAVYGFGSVRRLAWTMLVQSPVAQTVRHADAVLVLSPADIPIVRSMGATGAEFPIVTNGVDLPATAVPADDVQVLERRGIAASRMPGEITCMFLANHTPNKGLPILLEAFRSVSRPYCLIVGGERRDGVDYAAFERAAGPGQRIVVTGRLEDDEVSPLMRRSDLFVFPTLADTLPLVVLEAMAHELPVLASAVGGIPYELGEDCGRLVPAGDPAALASAIDEMAADPRRLIEMGARARQRVASHFNWEQSAREAISVYESVLQRRTAQRRQGTLDGLPAIGMRAPNEPQALAPRPADIASHV